MGKEDIPDFEQEGGELGDFVPAVFARSVEEAEEYRQLLDDHDIPAIVGGEDRPEGRSDQPGQRGGFSRGVPVLVPEALLDEAGEVIAERDEADEFDLKKEEADEEEDEEEEFELDESDREGEKEDLSTDLDEEENEEDEKEKDDLEDEDLFGYDDSDDEEDEDEEDGKQDSGEEDVSL